MPRLVILLFTLLLLSTPGYGQVRKLKAQHFSASDGILSDGVWRMVQDDTGLLWLGMQGFLVRYDGTQFRAMELRFSEVSADTTIKRLFPVGMAVGPKGNIWFISDKQLFIFDPKTERFTNFSNAEIPISSSNDITSMSFSLDNRLWVITRRNDVFQFQITYAASDGTPTIQQKSIYGPSHGNLFGATAGKSIVDPDGHLWLSSSRGLLRWDTAKQRFQLFQWRPSNKDIPENRFFQLFYSKREQRIWLPNREAGLLKFDPKTQKFELAGDQLSFKSLLVEREYQLILEDRKGWVWFTYREGGYRKLMRLRNNPFLLKEVQFNFLPPPIAPVSNDYKCLLEDQQGNIWIGLHNGGLIKYQPHFSAFETILIPNVETPTATLDQIGKVVADSSGFIWVLSNQYGLVRWDPKQKRWDTNLIEHFGSRSGSVLYSDSGIHLDRDGIVWFWKGNSLWQYQHLTDKFVAIHEKYPTLQAFLKSGIEGFSVDQNGHYWMSNYDQIARFQPSTQQLSVAFTAKHPNIVLEPHFGELYVDRDHRIWFGTSQAAFGYFLPEQQQLKQFTTSPGRLFTEDDTHVYIGTFTDGVLQINKQTLQVNFINRERGMPSNKIRGGLAVDDNGYLWIGTNRGLVRFDPASNTLHTFTAEDGLPSNYFTSVVVGKDSDGKLLFGTTKGLLRFHPDSIQRDTHPPQIVFNELDLFGERVYPDPDGPLKQSLQFTKRLRLRHDQNDFSISFAALHYKNPKANQYAVKLTPLQTTWRRIGNQNSISYNNLSPGHYTLHVIAANSDGIWNETGSQLAIYIRPPWYWNGWSKFGYLLVSIGLIIGIYRFQLNRKVAIAEAAQLRQLDTFKTKLYTNITHEFRTPLTVIQGITQNISGHSEEKKLIQRNSRQLLHLINQMLDLTKHDEQKVSVHLIQGDVLSYLRYVTESFHSLAIQQKINLNFYADSEVILMDYDPDKLLRILSNLILNALKFTPEYGKILITTKHQTIPFETLLLTIRDTGIGIPAASLPYIFDRFYQVNNESPHLSEGTGVGLALTKELINLLGGTIHVESQPKQGTSFHISLPISRNALFQEELPAPTLDFSLVSTTPQSAPQRQEATTSDIQKQEKPLLLIVEDNADVRQYLTICLQKQYYLIYAHNGQEGVEIAMDHIPDSIISDVMMPRLDGFELCQILKKDQRTSHIPIILLTARATIEDRLSGLEQGADAYLAKPFSEAELHIRLRNLIELRASLRQRYASALPELANLPENDPEALFLQRLNQFIHERLDDERLTVERLSKAMLMNRVQLHRKLSALTGLSPSAYLKKRRLHYAHRLLQDTNLRVGEIASRVGFSTHAHFSRSYRQEFGEAPSVVQQVRPNQKAPPKGEASNKR